MKGKDRKKGIHEALKRLGSIFEAEGHEVELERSNLVEYCHFWNVVFVHGYLIASLFQI
jgi:hypothetical protein